MPDSPTLTKDDRGDYRTDDGRWLAEKIGDGYRLWRTTRTDAIPAGEFSRLAAVRQYLASLEDETS